MLRVFATVYVADYELRPRYYIPFLIAFIVDGVLMAISYTLIAGASAQLSLLSLKRLVANCEMSERERKIHIL